MGKACILSLGEARTAEGGEWSLSFIHYLCSTPLHHPPPIRLLSLKYILAIFTSL